jgi:hypothetical protein
VLQKYNVDGFGFLKAAFENKASFHKDLFFCLFLVLLLLPFVITFCLPIVIIFFFSPRQTNERTNERMVNLPFSRHVHLLLIITNFLPFASFLFL